MPETLILSGKEVSKTVYQELHPRIEALQQRGITPGLAVVLVGNDPASQVYVRSKTRKFANLNLFSETIRLPENSTPEDVLKTITDLNQDERFHGILVQLPLPRHIPSQPILEAIDPRKDVDGFHPENLGRLVLGKPRFIPCTPKGIMRIFRHYHIPLEGKHVVILGRSAIVGRPLSILTSLKQKAANATTTLCHSRTTNIEGHTRQADILIAALGSPEFVNQQHIKEGVVIIDVGINRMADDSEKGYHLVGDVKRTAVEGIASALTPVPGGVGPMTIAMLVENTVEAAEK
ncbi:MAG: bifunctional 5,10-methylenetetrahydrofolate dehydrogenase/5,10-methenyltetrahydrofolate cyclohydrolase [Fidelibacterota bacterium]